MEIGALRGDTTSSLLDELDADVEFHVIDPVPQFDPDEYARRFPGRFVFHRDTSLRVLPELEAVDMALIDGDHNWYTVYNELRLLDTAARRADRPVPVLVLHDVCWPYGRRDGYYEPKRIPRRFRKPNAKLGLERGCTGLVAQGGANQNLWNAKQEGGRRNGVRTALEDFLADHPSTWRAVYLEMYSGLAIVVPVDRLTDQPRLAEYVDRLDTQAEQDRIAVLAAGVVRDAIATGTLRLSG